MATKYIKIFYDWLETTAMLSPAEKGRLIDALVAYARGQPRKLSGKAAILFPVFKGQIDRDMESYDAQVNVGRAYGRLGGRPKKNPGGFPITPGVFQKPLAAQDKDKDEEKGKDNDSPPASLPLEEAEEDSLSSPDWKRVVDAYHREIGGLPSGTALETFSSYVEDLGPDAVIVAIRKTNEAQPNNPWRFLKAILDRFADANVRSESEALAVCSDHERQRHPQPTPPTPAKPEPEVKWLV